MKIDKLKKFKYVKILVNVIYYFGFFAILAYFATMELSNPSHDWLINLVNIVILLELLFYIVYFISAIVHELGHLIFGLKAKLTFNSFCIFGYTFYLENDKLKIKKAANVPGILGYCCMITEKGKSYNRNSISFFYIGGIIFNIILVFISIILLNFTSNIYLIIFYILSIGINSYFAINNSIPSITNSGVSTDALQLIYHLEDEEYVNIMSNLTVLQNMMASGCELKNIDSSLFSNPQIFKNNTDVLNAMFYVDYLSSKEQYHEASEYANKILKDGKDFLTRQNIIIIKLQLIICIFYSGDDFNKIKEIWDEDIKKYLDLMGNVAPVYIGINYLYAALIEENEINSEKYLNKFQKLRKNNYNKFQIKNAEELINDVKKKIKE